MKQPILTLLCILLIISGCRKCKEDPIPATQDPTSARYAVESNTLPPATTIGAGTMGCLVNGEVWLAIKETSGGGFKWDIEFELTNDGGLNLSGGREYFNFYDIMFIGGSPVDIDFNYPENEGFISFLFQDQIDSCGLYDTDSIVSYDARNFEITNLDLEAKILSGLFDMRVINIACQDTLFITDGRFDLKGN